MTAITFTLKKNPAFKLDCSRLTPNNLAGLSTEQIKNLQQQIDALKKMNEVIMGQINALGKK